VGARECLIGIDVGSTSTKAALMTETGTVAAGFYTRTAGNPIGAVQSLLAAVKTLPASERRPARFPAQPSPEPAGKLAAGSSERIWVLDEITAHARAACELKPDVDTIIEIGGQDSKFTT